MAELSIDRSVDLYTHRTSGMTASAKRFVAYVPDTTFYPDGRGANQMRLSVCHPTEHRIPEGIARLGAVLRDGERLDRSPHT